jgi:hypothetical protein
MYLRAKLQAYEPHQKAIFKRGLIAVKTHKRQVVEYSVPWDRGLARPSHARPWDHLLNQVMNPFSVANAQQMRATRFGHVQVTPETVTTLRDETREIDRAMSEARGWPRQPFMDEVE